MAQYSPSFVFYSLEIAFFITKIIKLLACLFFVTKESEVSLNLFINVMYNIIYVPIPCLFSLFSKGLANVRTFMYNTTLDPLHVITILK